MLPKCLTEPGVVQKWTTIRTRQKFYDICSKNLFIEPRPCWIIWIKNINTLLLYNFSWNYIKLFCRVNRTRLTRHCVSVWMCLSVHAILYRKVLCEKTSETSSWNGSVLFKHFHRRSSMASCVPVTDPSRLSDDRYHIRESLSRPPRSSQYKKRAGIPRFCSIFLSAWFAPDIGIPQQYLVCFGRILVQCF